ncbi:MAG: glycosyltransferase [Patescibacteria group bacterium]
MIVGCFYAIPVVIHDSDTIPGLTNRLSARLARFIELAFASAAGRLPKVRAQINIVGNPVRKFLLDKVPAISAKSDLKFDPAKPLMLVFGGSQGSNRMNDFIIANLETILLKFQIMHVVGKEKFADYKNQFDFLTKNYSPILMTNYHYAEYLGNQEMNVAMDAADLIVARGGSGSIFEIAAKGKPSIIVPFPESAADHQKENAYDYAASGAAEVIEQENLLPSIFMSEAEKLVFQPEANAKMVAAANAFARPDSAEKIAVDILTLIS